MDKIGEKDANTDFGDMSPGSYQIDLHQIDIRAANESAGCLAVRLFRAGRRKEKANAMMSRARPAKRLQNC